jgi:hypothetical protein
VPAERSSRGGRRPSRTAGLVVLALLLGLTVWSVAALQPPAPAPADAPAQEFSATRAFTHVQDIAAETHVVGSDADQRVIDGLVQTLTGLGLDTGVQHAVGATRTPTGTARMAGVRNVVAVLPGSDSTGRLFLMAHHDSVETGPGAADDAAAVAALLESVRALTEGPQLRNDVVVVLTDGEEACLCGAEAFASSHSLAGDGGVVLNFEARGTTGPPVMFETSRGNADLAAAFAAAAPHPVASSFAVEVYRTLPNDTDFSVMLADGGFTGLNTAFIDGAAAYHTPQDAPGRLNKGTLQALGDNALAMTRELGNRDLTTLATPAGTDATYFPVLGRLVRYDGALVWPLAGAALVGAALFVLAVRRRGLSSLPRTAAATALTALPLVLGPLAAQGLWWLLVAVRPGYASMLDPWRPGPYRLAVVVLVVAVVLLWYALLRRWLGPSGAAVGGVVWLAVLAAVLAHQAPGGSYLVAWPALAGAVLGGIAALTSSRVVQVGAALLSGTVAVLVLAPTVSLFFPALGLATAAAPAAMVALLAVALLPAFELLFADPASGRRHGWLADAAVPVTALVLAAACTVAGLTVDTFDESHPVPSRLAYVQDDDRDQAWWVTTETAPGAYTAGFVDSHDPLPADYPYLIDQDVETGAAESAGLPAPVVVPVSDTVVGGRREIRVRVTPQRPGVRLVVLDLRIDGGTIVGSRVAGRAVPDAVLGKDRLWLVFHAPPADGLRAWFTVQGDGAASLRVIDGSVGLEGLPGVSPRPKGVDVAGSHTADMVLVSATTDLG